MILIEIAEFDQEYLSVTIKHEGHKPISYDPLMVKKGDICTIGIDETKLINDYFSIGICDKKGNWTYLMMRGKSDE